MTRASTVCSALALIYLLIGPVLAQVDLSDTDCPNCAPKLLREPEKPQQQKKDDEAVEKGKEQSQKTYEDYTEEEARQKKNQQQR